MPHTTITHGQTPTRAISRSFSKMATASGLVLLGLTAITSQTVAQSAYVGNATPISEEQFLNSGGLGFVSSSDLITDSNGVPEGFIEMAALPGDPVSSAQHDDADIPGLHRPALPAVQNPTGSSSASVSSAASVSTADAYAASAAISSRSTGASSSFTTDVNSSFNQAAVALPSALLDTSNNGVASASLSGRRSMELNTPASAVPSLTPSNYSASSTANAASRSNEVSPTRFTSPLLDQDLSIPPVSDLPIPELDLPSTDVVVENSFQKTREIKSSDEGDFAFVTRQLDKVGVDSSRMKVEVGTGMISRPTYIGSDESEMLMIPHADIEYMDRIFLSTDRGVGVTVFDAKRFDADVFATWRRGRESTGDLKNFAEKKGSVAVGFEVGSNFGPLRLSLNTDYAVTGDINGLKSDLDLSYAQSLGNKFTAVVTAGARAGDAEYIDSLFGVTRVDYARSALVGLGQFEGNNASLVDVHGGIDASYRFTPNFSLNMDLGTSLLMGDAADSPIVEFFGKPLQFQTAITTRYKF